MKKKVWTVGLVFFWLVTMFGAGLVWAAAETDTVQPEITPVLAAGGDSPSTSDTRAEAASDRMDYGSIEDSVYRNNYLGISLPIPKDWQVQGEAVVKQMMESDKEALAGDDQNFKASLDAADQNSLVLLTIFRYPLGTQVTYNPSIVWVAEKVSLYPGIQTGRDYLLNVRKIMESGQIQFQFNKEIYSQMLGGVSFDLLETQVNIAKMTVYQKYYATIRKGYAISFVISYATDDEARLLESILAGLKFVQ